MQIICKFYAKYYANYVISGDGGDGQGQDQEEGENGKMILFFSFSSWGLNKMQVTFNRWHFQMYHLEWKVSYFN